MRPARTATWHHHASLFGKMSAWSLWRSQKRGTKQGAAVRREEGSCWMCWIAQSKCSWATLPERKTPAASPGGWKKGSKHITGIHPQVSQIILLLCNLLQLQTNVAFHLLFSLAFTIKLWKIASSNWFAHDQLVLLRKNGVNYIYGQNKWILRYNV